jgi:hypothetical protein
MSNSVLADNVVLIDGIAIPATEVTTDYLSTRLKTKFVS